MADLRNNGGTTPDGKIYNTAQEFIDQVDLSAWDLASACGSCHIGGGLTEMDKSGTRYPQRAQADPINGPFNAYDFTVFEYWMADGSPAHYVNDMGINSHLNSDGSLVDGDSNPATGKFAGFAPTPAPWQYSYPLDMNGDGDYTDSGIDMPNFMMPNVREMDCMFCHLEGFNNIVSSVAVQMGALNAAPAMGAGLMNMFTQAYIPGAVDKVTVPGPMGDMDVAVLSGDVISRIKGNPPSDNCRLCHSPTTMENFPDMFDKFLAAAPMSFEPGSPFAGPTGLAMPSYDLNAPFEQPGSSSPVVYGQADGSWVYGDGSDAGGPFNGMFPMALFQSYRNVVPLDATMGEIGGGNLGGTGPIYFAGGATGDQSALKKAVIPFPRADFFKRGDIWDDGNQDVHHRFECAGCHFDTNSLDPDKDQCDPGRGFARLGGVESGFNGGPDSKNTVKSCENCHITGQSDAGETIVTFGAPDPQNAHAAAGLTANIVTAIGAEGEFLGNHLDVVDCTVCHTYKESMAVRALDCTSGNRYPTMIGFENYKGMMAMFTDPLGVKDIPEDQFNAITGLPYPKSMYVNEMQPWIPLKGWWQSGPQLLEDGSPNPDYRRKVYNINMITAVLWDNDGSFDANGDTVAGDTAGLDAHGFDPWIQRDLKAGMNFADTGFASVPIGFGAPTSTYGSAYDASGKFTGAWEYVGVYGGNAIFTNPDQINSYQAMRTMQNPSKPWDSTKLIYYGGPFQVTHNTVDTDVFALGKGGSCNDCHDAASGFFSGDYDMTGTAVPASATFDPDGPGPMPETDSGMMERPALDFEVIAEIDDLVTGCEGQTKDGVAVEVEYEELGCWDETNGFIVLGQASCSVASHKRTKDMSRAEFLYQEDTARVALMEANKNPADYGIGVDPVAAISSINGGSPVVAGTAVDLIADTGVNSQGYFTYSWTFNDGSYDDPVGSTVSKTFAAPGTYLVGLKVIDEEGKLDQVAQYVTVVAPAPAADITSTDNGIDNVQTVSFNNLPATYTRLYISWGDGYRANVYPTGSPDPYTMDHTFRKLSRYYNSSTGMYEYNAAAYVYNGSSRVDILRSKISISP